MKLLFCLFLFTISFQLYGQERLQWELYKDSLNYYHKQKDFKNCIVYYDKLIGLYPNSTNYVLIKGEFLYSAKEYRAAIREFSRVLNINNKIVDAFVRRGRSYLRLHKYDSGILDLSAGLGKYKYQDSAIYLYRSYAYDLIGDEARAKQDYDSARRFHRSVQELHQSLGLVKYEMQDLKGAVIEFNKAIKIDGNFWPAIKARALANFDFGFVRDCFNDCQLYLGSHPNDIELNYIIAVCYFEQKDYKSALRHVIKCKTNLNTKGVYYLSGMANFYLVNDKEAINDFTTALKLNPTSQEEGQLYYTIGLCKNNIELKSGCNEILIAIQKGCEEAKKNYPFECK